MKSLIIVRHCKSSWADLSLSDFDRPLNKRGNIDGELMSNYLREKEKKIDKLILSTSKRTRLTSKYFTEKIHFDSISYLDELYHASYSDIINIISKVENNFNSIMVIGHNPGLTELINQYTIMNIYNLPTTGVVKVEFKGDKWDRITENKGIIVYKKFPKELKL
tara:strand:+ start:2271 stop:2762 length:492 start_codon:yes stop_codon:yes gene_type:complete